MAYGLLLYHTRPGDSLLGCLMPTELSAELEGEWPERHHTVVPRPRHAQRRDPPPSLPHWCLDHEPYPLSVPDLRLTSTPSSDFLPSAPLASSSAMAQAAPSALAGHDFIRSKSAHFLQMQPVTFAIAASPLRPPRRPPSRLASYRGTPRSGSCISPWRT